MLKNPPKTQHDQLEEWLRDAYSSPPTPFSVYHHEARELIRLQNVGRLTPEILDPQRLLLCSYYQADKDVDYRNDPSLQPIAKAVNHQLSPYADCGLIFGPELMAGHVLVQNELHANNNEDEDPVLSIIKFSAGGPEIKKNWSKQLLAPTGGSDSQY
jgi:hypothetical protein